MNEQVVLAVNLGWVAAFHLYTCLVKCFLSILWIASLVFNSPNKYYILFIPLVIAAVDGFIFTIFDDEQTVRTKATLDAATKWNDFFIENTEMREMIVGYKQGLTKAQAFGEVHAGFNAKAFAAASIKRRAIFMTQYLPSIVITTIFCISWMDAVSYDDDTTVALFVTLISVVRSFEGTIGEIFSTVFMFSEAAASIQKIAKLVNSQTRRKDLYQVSKLRHALVEDAITKGIMSSNDERIVIHKVMFRYSTGTDITIPSCSFSIEPSQIISIDTDASFGKITLMKLLAYELLPDEGFIAYPPRWRVCTVTASPILFDNTLLANLEFGTKRKYSIHEVIGLCELLGMSNDLLDSLRSIDGKDEPSQDRSIMVGRMGERLSLSNRTIITIARALLGNVDLLIMINPIDTLGDKLRERVLKVMRDYVTDRGMKVLKSEYDRTPLPLKKKKTIIWTTRLQSIRDASDYIISLSTINDAFDGSLMSGMKKPEYSRKESDMSTVSEASSTYFFDNNELCLGGV